MSATSSAPFRIAVASLQQESVTFIDKPTPLAVFRAIESRGGEVVEKYRGTNTPVGGLIDGCEAEGAEIVPLFYAAGGAAGPTSDEAFEFYAALMAEMLTAALPVDGVLLDLHGAMATPTRLDADREMLELVRGIVGPDVPLMVALDYHANLDAASIAPATAVFGYHYSPHTDMGQTGRRAAECMFRTLRGEIDPVCLLVKPGVMVPSLFSATGIEPLRAIVDDSVAAAGTGPCIDMTVFAGFSFADVPNCGFAVVVVADRADEAAARVLAERYSARIHGLRAELNHGDLLHTVESGIARAQELVAAGRRPVVLLEHADRMNDSTYVLRAVLSAGLSRCFVPYLWDPAAVEKAMAAGLGATVTLSVGGHTSDKAGGPVEVTGSVIFAGEVDYRATGAYFTGRRINPGNTVLIDTGRLILSLTSRATTAVDGDCLTQFGLSLNDFDYIVLRSKTHFRAFYEPASAEIVMIDTPDWGPANLLDLPFRNIPVAEVYPFNARPGTA